MIADLFGQHIGTIDAITSLVTAIRPVAAGLRDPMPYLLYETSGLTQRSGLTSSLPWYEGKMQVHVCAIEWAKVNTICEALKMNLPDTTCADSTYRITRIKFEDESDMQQAAGADDSAAYFVRVIDFWVRACRL